MSSPRVINVSTSEIKADTYIGRGSRFGNPFPMGRTRSREQVIADFRDWIGSQPELLRLVRQVLPGHSLGCHCAPKPCHGDLLAEIASGAQDDRIPVEPVLVYASDQSGCYSNSLVKTAGQLYAIPSRDHLQRDRPIEAILADIGEFLRVARTTPETLYEISRMGSALSEQAIRDALLDAPPNVLLPGVWETFRHPVVCRVIVAGSRDFKDYDLLSYKLLVLLGSLMNEGKELEIVSGGARGADILGERFAVEHGLRLRRIPADWERFGKAAGGVRNERMGWYGTHLVAFWDGKSLGTKHMIDTARRERLPMRVVHV